MNYRYAITDKSTGRTWEGTATTHHNDQSHEDAVFIEDVMFAASDNGHAIRIYSTGETE